MPDGAVLTRPAPGPVPAYRPSSHGDPRSVDQITAHYAIERELADRLRRSNRAERSALFRTLYDELFARVPAHARLVRREDPAQTAREIAARFRLLQPWLPGVRTFLEFAPGDCRLAWHVCQHVPQVIAADISDQTGGAPRPANFQLLVYNGYDLALPDNSVDLAFSYQFIEHLHPEDVSLHFALAHRLLRPGGTYVFATPHRFSGPHDISRFFTDEPSGFHLKEWTYGELAAVARAAGFSRWHSYRFGQLRRSALVNGLTLLAEHALRPWPRALQRRLAARPFEGVAMAVRKPEAPAS